MIYEDDRKIIKQTAKQEVWWILLGSKYLGTNVLEL